MKSSTSLERTPRPQIHVRRDSLSLKDVADALFRKTLWITTGMLLISAATGFLLWYSPAQYESEMLLMLKNDRPELALAGNANSGQVSRETAESQIATEIALLSSDEMLSKVVIENGLVRNPSDGGELNRALKTFRKKLRITPGLKSNVISVSVTWNTPDTAASLLQSLADAYLDKHLQIHKVAGSLEFFQQETVRAESELQQAQAELAEFEQKNNTVSLDQQKTQMVKNLADLETARRDAIADLRGAEERTRVLQDQLANTASRITTQSKAIPNQYSAERLNTMLVELRNKRTELLTKYKPTDRMVQEIDQQIWQTLLSLDESRRQVSKEEATDVNPVRQTLEGELLQAQNRFAGTSGRLQAMTAQTLRLRQALSRMSAITGSHDDLVRKVKDAASRYELLATKWEQARIDDNLDRQRIANMVVAEAPTRKSVPQPKGDTNMIAGIVLALILVVGIAWIQGMRRKQVYTPWELEGIVGAPVLGAVPLQGPAHRRQLPAAPAPA